MKHETLSVTLNFFDFYTLTIFYPDLTYSDWFMVFFNLFGLIGLILIPIGFLVISLNYIRSSLKGELED
jgi:hypothetical protein